MSSEVDRNEAKPDNARRVHGKTDMLRLVEILRDLARLNSVHGANCDQQHVVDEG